MNQDINNLREGLERQQLRIVQLVHRVHQRRRVHWPAAMMCNMSGYAPLERYQQCAATAEVCVSQMSGTNAASLRPGFAK